MPFFRVVRLLLLIVLAFCVYRAAAEIASWVQSALDHTDAVMRAASRVFCSSDALAQTDACRWTVAKIRAPEAHRCDPAHWTWVDSLQIVLYLWLHEARMLVAFAAAVSVDLAVSGLARFVARRTAAAPPTTLSPLRRLSRRAATILATTLSSTTVHDIDTILPHSARVRATVAAFILVFLGADITTSLERFAAFSMQRPLRTSTPHRQWDATGEVNMHNPSPSPLVMDPFHTSMGKPIIVSNAWLECELDYALRTPGLVIVSGPRAIGKSTIVRKMVKNREGMYCDASSASTPEGLASVLEHCTTPHHLITVLWSPLANVFHVLTIPFSAWVPVNGFFSWLSILTRALQYRTPRASEADASVRAHLPSCWDDLERDDGDDDLLDYLMRTPNITIAPWSLNASGGSGRRQSRANREETAVESLPLVVVLDGIRDGQSVPLGVLEQSTPAMRFVREASRRAVVVIVAASDASLTLPALQHHEIVSVASRTTFVTAVPTSMQEAQPIYSRLAKLFEADEKLRRQRRPPPPITREHGAEATNATTAADEATALSCDMYARCAASWFAGAFEHLVSWLHLSRGSLSFEAGESGSSTPSSSSLSSTTAIEMTMAENIPSAAVCRGSADMVIHAAESLLADALMLSSPSASADESAAALGARLRTIHLAARLAASSIVSSLDALWKACRAHHEPNRTSPLRGGSDSDIAFARMICSKFPASVYAGCPKGAALPGEDGCPWPNAFPAKELIQRSGWVFAAEVDPAAKALLMRQQVATMSVVSNLRCGALFHLALQPRGSHDARNHGSGGEESDDDATTEDAGTENEAPQSSPDAESLHSDPFVLKQRLSDVASARLTVTAPYYRFAIARLLLRRNHTIREMCGLYLDRLTAAVPGFALGRTTHVRAAGERLCADVTRLVDDVRDLLQAEAATSPCVSTITEPFLPGARL
jgi:hypothetical protein